MNEPDFRTLADATLDGIALYADHFVYVNPSLARMSGYSRRELMHMHPRDLFGDLPEEAAETELRLSTKDGLERWVRVSEKPLGGEGMHLLNLTDVTDRKLLESRLVQLTTLDPVTAVLNHNSIEEVLNAEIARVRRYGGKLSLIAFAVDEFMEIIQFFGRTTGDYVLKTLAEILRRNMRASDHMGRWRRDEFLIIAPSMQLTEATGFAVKLRRFIAGYEFGNLGTITASFGIAEYHPEESGIALIDHADAAMHRAKRQGRNRVEASREG